MKTVRRVVREYAVFPIWRTSQRFHTTS